MKEFDGEMQSLVSTEGSSGTSSSGKYSVPQDRELSMVAEDRAPYGKKE